MRDELLELLRCPRCKAEGGLALDARERDEREVREGTLRCGACQWAYEVSEGIVDLLHDPPDFVVREAAGLERFAETMRREGWGRERILRLPYDDELGYWHAQAASMEQLLETIPFRAGERVMDVGSNTCWASAILAERGLEVVALDIAKAQMQGLRTAEWWFDDRDVYFERVLGTMFDPPLASGSLDYVLCCEVLHHNDRRTLPMTMRELHRVLRPGGTLLVINETMRFPLDLKRDHAREVAEYEGYEHTFFFHQYWLAAKRAGFNVEVLEPAYHHFFRGDVYGVGPETSAVDTLKIAAVQLARGHRLGRRLYLAWRNLVAGQVALSMVCEKPAPSRGG